MKKPRPGYPEAWLFRTGNRLEPGFLQMAGNIADGTDHCTEIGTGQCHVRGQNVGNAAEIKAAFTAEQAAQEIIETQPAENVAQAKAVEHATHAAESGTAGHLFDFDLRESLHEICPHISALRDNVAVPVSAVLPLSPWLRDGSKMGCTAPRTTASTRCAWARVSGRWATVMLVVARSRIAAKILRSRSRSRWLVASSSTSNAGWRLITLYCNSRCWWPTDTADLLTPTWLQLPTD